MTDSNRTFAVASDEALVDLISRARRRLVVIAPALTQAVAEAVSRRFDDLDQLDMTVVLDSDPEVYRLGFGDHAALETVRAASAKSLFGLREQPGVRIGVVIADDRTMVYAPVSKNVEAGSTSVEHPNAVVFSGSVSDQIAKAADSDKNDAVHTAEVGNAVLDAGKVQAMLADLNANPPKPFDIARKLNVFASKVQYVEFTASNYRLTTRQIPLPAELVDVADDDLKKRITGRIRGPFDDIGKLDVTIDRDGKPETVQVDDNWLRSERKRIEDEYTYQINNFGRVILYNDRDTFEEETRRFKLIVQKYQTAMSETLRSIRSNYENRIVEEFSPRWKQNPPKRFPRWNIDPTPENIEVELRRLAKEIFDKAITFDKPVVKILYKNIAPENVQDAAFLETLKKIMVSRHVPRDIIDSLFESGQAAPQTGSFIDD